MIRSLMLGVRPRVVEAPGGARWTVRRVWVGRPLPRWRRVRAGGAASEAASQMPFPDGGSLEDLAAGMVLLVGAFVFAVVLIPLLLFGLELIILGLLVAAGILGRALLGRPWVVRATPAGGAERALAWKVTGLRRSGRVIDEVAASLTNGISPAPADAEALLAETASVTG
jgi:hypothetical protein